VYDDFCHANDPYEEHDFGSFEADGAVIFFKIDYFDKALLAHSPDPSDPSVTERVIVITIMLAEEYVDLLIPICTCDAPEVLGGLWREFLLRSTSAWRDGG
jgi:hypothetical protein